jgi:HSP20 family protein
MKRLRSMLPWNWGEREESGSRLLPVSRYSSFPSLFSSLENQLQELNRWVEQFFNEPGLREFNWRPNCQIMEEPNNYILRVDLPGVSQENIKVELKDNFLTINAERRSEQDMSPNAQLHMSELTYGMYSRSFNLPEDADTDNITAEFSNGVLTIRVPKQARSASTKTIQVQKK